MAVGALLTAHHDGCIMWVRYSTGYLLNAAKISRSSREPSSNCSSGCATRKTMVAEGQTESRTNW